MHTGNTLMNEMGLSCSGFERTQFFFLERGFARRT
jgi:hypothetical protein